MPQQNFEAGGIVQKLAVNGGRQYFPYNEEVAGTYGMPKEPLINEYKAMMNQKKNAFGIGNEYYEDEREAIKLEKEKLAQRRKELPYDGMIRAGLNIAAGESDDFVTNAARGAIPAFNKYGEEAESVRKEEKLNRKEDRLINKQLRAEAMGDMAGFDAYNKEIRATQLKLIEIETDKLSKALTRGIAANSEESKKRMKAMEYAGAYMKSKYGDAVLVTKFADDKSGYDKEFFELFMTQYKALGGNDPSMNKEFISSLIEMTPESKGSNKYWKL